MGRIPDKLLHAVSPVTIVCGHYGVGKTNLSVNLALDFAKMGKHVTLADMDIVNPYFRASEERDLLEANGIDLIAPVFAERGSSLDTPSLRGTVIPAIEDAYDSTDSIVVIDAGGDDVGATALGRFAHVINKGRYSMLYVVNASRNMTHTPAEALEILRDVETASHLLATSFLDNTHLKQDTTPDVLESSEGFCREFSKLSGLELVGKTVPQEFVKNKEASIDEHSSIFANATYPINIVIKSPWE